MTSRDLVLKLLPRRWAQEAEAASRRWFLVCRCGHAVSVWDAGGLRWKAAGRPARVARCPRCGPTLHRVEFRGREGDV